jgi:hypothetical protein
MNNVYLTKYFTMDYDDQMANDFDLLGLTVGRIKQYLLR